MNRLFAVLPQSLVDGDQRLIGFDKDIVPIFVGLCKFFVGRNCAFNRVNFFNDGKIIKNARSDTGA